MRVAELMNQWQWRPIRHCPGRFVLITGNQSLSFPELLGGNYPIHSFTCSSAKDTVLVVTFEDGGLISYARVDGSILHTLNTPEGFRRKLAQLGIQPDPQLISRNNPWS